MPYEFDGKKYESASKHQREWGTEIVRSLILSGNERILDLGCGDGGLTAILANSVPAGSVLGIDSSENMIETAKRHESENLHFEKMDISDLNFNDEFDVIFSNAALHWVKDHRSLLNNAHKALRKDGKILWDFASDGNCSCFFSVVRGIIASSTYERFFAKFEWPWYMPKVSEYRKMICDAGFSEYQVEGINKDRYFANAEEMIKWIDQPSIIPFITYLPNEMQMPFRNEVVNKMLEKCLRSDGTCFETFRRVRVYAVND